MGTDERVRELYSHYQSEKQRLRKLLIDTQSDLEYYKRRALKNNETQNIVDLDRIKAEAITEDVKGENQDEQ